ncbi:thiamine diphosphokinase [Chloroflexota bacterium]
MRTIIFANGELNSSFRFQPDDLIIAADGGSKHCLAMGIQPHIVIGDLDSLSKQDLAVLKSGGAQIIQYPRQKDFTDLELAIEYARDHDAKHIVILAALGARWDQTIANLLLPAAFHSLSIQLLDGNQEIHFVSGGKQLVLAGAPGDTVSLIPLAGDAVGITTLGLEYPLSDEILYFGSTRGVSNLLMGDQASISLKEGFLLCAVLHTGK